MTSTNGSRPRHPCCLPCLIVLTIHLLLALTTTILAITIIKLRTPTTTLLSTTISSISPRVTLSAVHISLNISFSLRILIRNPNRASFSHCQGTTLLYYRGVQVGEANVAEGRFPARGEEVVGVALTVEAGKVTSELGRLFGDVLEGKGGVGFDIYRDEDGVSRVYLSPCSRDVGVSCGDRSGCQSAE